MDQTYGWDGRKKDRHRPHISSQATGANRVPLPEEPQINMVVNVITCGSSIASTSRNATKRYCREARNSQPSRTTSLPPCEITFDTEDLSEVHLPHDDALVISLLITNCQVKRILVDNGRSSNIILLRTFQGMGIWKRQIIPSFTMLVGFSGEWLNPLGEITFHVYSVRVNLSTRF